MIWVTVGDSVAGTSHRKTDLPCQDAFRIGTLGTSSEWLVIAVADGAGCASFSQVGARLACDEFIRQVGLLECSAVFTRDGMTTLFSEVREELVREADRQRVDVQELACTALFVIVGPTSAAFAQIGDGAIVIANEEEPNYRIVFWPTPAEYANATYFLTDDRFAARMQFETEDNPIHEIALFTDGLQRLALDFTNRAPHGPFFRPLFDQLRGALDPESLAAPFREFLDSARVNERTDDDKTLVFAVRQS